MGLPPMAVYQSTYSLADSPQSGASPLPQLIFIGLKIMPGL
ncbi:hypothetical protein C4J96_0394 [Pseudomonas orientalis]|nr:hypothetical protein C4J96_0394 [Pseudomonas orientalis]